MAAMMMRLLLISPVIERIIGARPSTGISWINIRYGKSIFSTIPEIFIRSASTNPAAVPTKNPSRARKIVALALVSTTIVALIPADTCRVENAAAIT